MGANVGAHGGLGWPPVWNSSVARAINKLNVRQVAALSEPGRHADGGGLYLRITPAGGRSWVFMATSGGKRQEIGLGAASSVTLATARRLATEMREAVATGRDPRAVLVPEPHAAKPTVPTFRAFAEEYIVGVEQGWRNPIHRQQWRNSLRDHAKPVLDVPVDEVNTDHVLMVLRPIWTLKSETAKRIRGRLERILDAAKARGHRSRDSINPATWRGHLSVLLPAPSKLARGHHPALSWQDAPSFMIELRSRKALTARCLEFVILTAARSGEALGAKWNEIDFASARWVVPAARMKAGAEHVVPLSSAALNLLQNLRPEHVDPDERMFAVAGAIRSNMAMAMLLRRMGHGAITTHGFRSTFRDWAGDASSFPRELVEQALAHTIQNKAERAYRRGTAIERRRELMESWAEYLDAKN